MLGGFTSALQYLDGEIVLEPCISAQIFYIPRAGLRANFHVIVQTRAGPRACFRILLIFIF